MGARLLEALKSSYFHVEHADRGVRDFRRRAFVRLSREGFTDPCASGSIRGYLIEFSHGWTQMHANLILRNGLKYRYAQIPRLLQRISKGPHFHVAHADRGI